MVSHFNEPTGIKVHRFQWNVFGFNLPKRPPIDQASLEFLGRRRFEKDLFKMLREGGFLLYIDCLVYVSNSRVTHARITHHPLKNLPLSLSALSFSLCRLYFYVLRPKRIWRGHPVFFKPKGGRK